MAFIESWLDLVPADVDQKTKILTSCEEITINIINFAYTVISNAVIITFVDHGIPFNPMERSDAALDRSFEDLGPGGFGIFIVGKLMDDVQYEYRDHQNILQLTRRIPVKGQ